MPVVEVVAGSVVLVVVELLLEEVVDEPSGVVVEDVGDGPIEGGSSSENGGGTFGPFKT